MKLPSGILFIRQLSLLFKENMMKRTFPVFLLTSILMVTACAPQVTANSVPLPTPESSTSVDTQVPNNPPATCPITRAPNVLFTPPSPYPATPPSNYVGEFWHGTPELWTMLRPDATWSGLPQSGVGYTQKIFWWRQGYNMDAEPNPKLTVTGKRLDEQAPPLVASSATNASADFGQAMLVGVDIPTLGCWEITGQYKGSELSFVVWIAP
jgi:hypothetical protein